MDPNNKPQEASSLPTASALLKDVVDSSRPPLIRRSTQQAAIFPWLSDVISITNSLDDLRQQEEQNLTAPSIRGTDSVMSLNASTTHPRGSTMFARFPHKDDNSFHESSAKRITKDSLLSQDSKSDHTLAYQQQDNLCEDESQKVTVGSTSAFEIKGKVNNVVNFPELVEGLKTEDFMNRNASSSEVKYLDLRQLAEVLYATPEFQNCLARSVFEMLKSQSRRETKPRTQGPEDPKLEMRVLTREEFKPNAPPLHENPDRAGHLIANSQKTPSYAIEVLLKESVDSTQRTRHIRNKMSSQIIRDSPVQDIPDKIRIRSAFLLKLLQRVTSVRLDHGGSNSSVNEPTSLLFLYPFKFFILYADKIEAEVTRLEAKFGNDSQIRDSAEPLSRGDGTAPDGHTDTPADGDDQFESKNAYEHLRLVKTLLATHLNPIFELRKGYLNATHTIVAFQDLWLLFEAGGLVWQREPQPGYPPSISRVTHFDGGRELLNNSDYKGRLPRRIVCGPNSKGAENRFFLRHYTLDFNGENYGPVEDILSMPPWEGTRSVYDLKVFPLNFCRDTIDHKFTSREAFLQHVIRRGKDFVNFDTINHRRYKGKVVGSKYEAVSLPPRLI